MKKKIICTIAAITAFSMVGCAKSNTIKNDNGEVKLGDYKKLAVEKKLYTVTDENVQVELQNSLYDYVKYNKVKRAAKIGDYLSLKFTATADGKELANYNKDGIEIVLGNEEFGTEFDEKLTSVKAGSKIDFQITYAKDYADETWAGKKITFKGTVEAVKEEIFPECTDEFVSEKFGVESYDELLKEVRSSLEADNASNSEYELHEALVQKVVENSEIKSYSDKLFEESKNSLEEQYSDYMSMYGCETIDEFYKALGYKEEEVKEEILNIVYRTLIINAIIEKEKLTVDDSEYQERVKSFAEELGYETADEVIQEYGEEQLKEYILEEKVFELLQKDAVVTEVEASLNDEE